MTSGNEFKHVEAKPVEKNGVKIVGGKPEAPTGVTIISKNKPAGETEIKNPRPL